MTVLEERRFLFVTGKGGVGKTTVSAALGRALAARGRRTLVAAAGNADRLATLLGQRDLGTSPREVAPLLWALRIEPRVAFREYGELILKSKLLSAALFENRVAESFLNGVPGLPEWAILGKSWHLATNVLGRGGPAFDTVILDAPATGHGLEMLRVPKVIVDAVPPSALRRDAERAWSMFKDPEQSGIVVVTLPEEMPVNETFELVSGLQNELELPIAKLIINATLPYLFEPDEWNELEGAQGLDPKVDGDRALLAGQRRSSRERLQNESIKRLKQLELDSIELPQLQGGSLSPEASLTLSKRL